MTMMRKDTDDKDEESNNSKLYPTCKMLQNMQARGEEGGQANQSIHKG